MGTEEQSPVSVAAFVKALRENPAYLAPAEVRAALSKPLDGATLPVQLVPFTFYVTEDGAYVRYCDVRRNREGAWEVRSPGATRSPQPAEPALRASS
jgi:hypothetical protein